MAKTRYIAVIDFYVWADSEVDAYEEASQIAKEIDNKLDNRCTVIELHENITSLTIVEHSISEIKRKILNKENNDKE